MICLYALYIIVPSRSNNALAQTREYLMSTVKVSQKEKDVKAENVKAEKMKRARARCQARNIRLDKQGPDTRRYR